MKKVLFASAALCAGMAMADLTSPSANWTKKYTEPVWWFDSTSNWECYDTYSSVRRTTGDGFPAYHDQVFIGDWRSGGLTVYLKT